MFVNEPSIQTRHWVPFRFLFPLNLFWPALLMYESVVWVSAFNLSLVILAAKENIEIEEEFEYRTVLFGVGCSNALIQKSCLNNSVVFKM